MGHRRRHRVWSQGSPASIAVWHPGSWQSLQIAYAKVNLNIVNVTTTSEVVFFSSRVPGEYETLQPSEIVGFGGTASYDSTLNGKVLDLAIREAVNNLVNGIETGAWRPANEETDDDALFPSFLLLVSGLLLSACARGRQTLYNWEQYQGVVYQHMQVTTPGSEAQIDAGKTSKKRAPGAGCATGLSRSPRHAVRPARQGCPDSQSSSNREAPLPRIGPFMNFLMSNKKERPNDPAPPPCPRWAPSSWAAVHRAPVTTTATSRESRPTSILVLPPVNHSPDIKAGPSLQSQITYPLAESGYYVLPVAVTNETFQQNGVTEPADIQALPSRSSTRSTVPIPPSTSTSRSTAPAIWSSPARQWSPPVPAWWICAPASCCGKAVPAPAVPSSRAIGGGLIACCWWWRWSIRLPTP